MLVWQYMHKFCVVICVILEKMSHVTLLQHTTKYSMSILLIKVLRLKINAPWDVQKVMGLQSEHIIL